MVEGIVVYGWEEIFKNQADKIAKTRIEIEKQIDSEVKLNFHIAVLDKSGELVKIETVLEIKKGRELNKAGLICPKSRKYFHLIDVITKKKHWVNSAYWDFYTGFDPDYSYKLVEEGAVEVLRKEKESKS